MKRKIVLSVVLLAVFVLCLGACTTTCQHELTAHQATAATCTTDGNVEYWQCAKCNKYFADKDGKTEITQQSTVVAAKGHTEKFVAGVNHGCDEFGRTEGKICSVCGEILEGLLEIFPGDHNDYDKDHICDACGKTTHTKEIVAAVEPTCTKTGLTEGQKCSICGEILVKQQVVATLSHNFENGVCSLCGITEAAAWGSEGLEFELTPEGNAYSVKIGACTDLDVIIPSTYNNLPVTKIGGWAFSQSNLTSITLPNTITTISDGAFHGCASLTTITLPESVTFVANGAFLGCNSLTEVTLPNNLTFIANNAFNGCTNLTSITIPESVTTIGDSAFCNCTALTSITLPESVTEIGESAFYGCASLTSIAIPNGVACIADYVFTDCSSLTNVTIPESVTSIGHAAFYGCASLTDITLPNSVTSIGYNAFGCCTGLTSFTIPEGVTRIEDLAFCVCSSLTDITIHNKVTFIGSNAFNNCASLESITIPESVTEIGAWAFANCTSLSKVNFENPNGWTNEFDEELSAEDLANPATAAEYITSTYCDYWWDRS